ncbi:MAG: T9SS type A sorting domain-containing protein [Ignavibacteria bacterium]|nr:T9SS type A sorting domain-containing protein [Ignavibacteria bacterium]
MPGLEGKYVYSDYTTGRIWALTWDGINPPVNQELFDTPYSIVSFAEDKFKNLFFIHFTASTGKIYKIIGSTVTSSGTVNSEVISDFTLYQNYPNPFNPSTLIRYSLKENGFISLKVYDIAGKEIRSLVNENQDNGNHSINFNAANLSSGIYYYTMTVNGIVNQTKRMVLLN